MIQEPTANNKMGPSCRPAALAGRDAHALGLGRGTPRGCRRRRLNSGDPPPRCAPRPLAWIGRTLALQFLPRIMITAMLARAVMLCRRVNQAALQESRIFHPQVVPSPRSVPLLWAARGLQAER